jgi:hypothetical protein
MFQKKDVTCKWVFIPENKRLYALKRMLEKLRDNAKTGFKKGCQSFQSFYQFLQAFLPNCRIFP